jgi:hypothetical protein
MIAARPAGLFLGLASSGLFGCSASSKATAASAAADPGDTVVCAPEGGPYTVDAYAPNLQKTGENGVLTFELVVADPAPPAAETLNTFVLKITHADGTLFTGQLAFAQPFPQGIFMPLHNHGPSSPIPTITFDASAGTYTLAQMNLFMPGLWRVTVDAYELSSSSEAGAEEDGGAMSVAPPPPEDVGVFYFCVE